MAICTLKDIGRGVRNRGISLMKNLKVQYLRYVKSPAGPTGQFFKRISVQIKNSIIQFILDKGTRYAVATDRILYLHRTSQQWGQAPGKRSSLI